MITYEEITAEIKVKLDGKHVGHIVGSREMGFWYKAKGGQPGERFATVAEVKRSLEVE